MSTTKEQSESLLEEQQLLTKLQEVHEASLKIVKDAWEEKLQLVNLIQLLDFGVMEKSTEKEDNDPQGVQDRIQLNIGGKHYDIRRRAELIGDELESPVKFLFRKRWYKYLLRDSNGRIYFDLEADWLLPLLKAAQKKEKSVEVETKLFGVFNLMLAYLNLTNYYSPHPSLSPLPDKFIARPNTHKIISDVFQQMGISMCSLQAVGLDAVFSVQKYPQKYVVIIEARYGKFYGLFIDLFPKDSLNPRGPSFAVCFTTGETVSFESTGQLQLPTCFGTGVWHYPIYSNSDSYSRYSHNAGYNYNYWAAGGLYVHDIKPNSSHQGTPAAGETHVIISSIEVYAVVPANSPLSFSYKERTTPETEKKDLPWQKCVFYQPEDDRTKEVFEGAKTFQSLSTELIRFQEALLKERRELFHEMRFMENFIHRSWKNILSTSSTSSSDWPAESLAIDDNPSMDNLRTIHQRLVQYEQLIEEYRASLQAPSESLGERLAREPIVSFNVEGKKVSVLRSTILRQVPGSQLAVRVSGRWREQELDLDGEGSLYVDFSREVFRPLIAALRLSRIAQECRGSAGEGGEEEKARLVIGKGKRGELEEMLNFLMIPADQFQIIEN